MIRSVWGPGSRVRARIPALFLLGNMDRYTSLVGPRCSDTMGKVNVGAPGFRAEFSTCDSRTLDLAFGIRKAKGDLNRPRPPPLFFRPEGAWSA